MVEAIGSHGGKPNKSAFEQAFRSFSIFQACLSRAFEDGVEMVKIFKIPSFKIPSLES
jgi:hypothetical protein